MCKRKRKVLISSGHYLATIDNGATFFLCFFHCSKKHAYCLFGVEWPIENVSWREKKTASFHLKRHHFIISNSYPIEQTNPLIYYFALEQEVSATFLCKEPDSNYLMFGVTYVVSAMTTQLHQCSAKAATEDMQKSRYD